MRPPGNSATLRAPAAATSVRALLSSGSLQLLLLQPGSLLLLPELDWLQCAAEYASIPKFETHAHSPTQVAKNAQRVYDELSREEAIFNATLAKGQKLLDDLLAAAAAGSKAVAGADAFLLYDSYGFPVELTVELAEARGIQVGI